MKDRDDEETERKIQAMVTDASELEHAKQFREETESYLKRRKQRQSKEWNESVYEPIQTRIKEKLTPDMLATLRDTRYELDWKSLLGISSTKEETDMVSLKIPLQDILDPLKADLMKIDEEQKLVHGENHESFLKPKMKLTLNPQRYARMSHLPQGRDEQILKRLEGQPIQFVPSGGNVITNHFKFDKTQDAVYTEFFTGGKKIFPSQHATTNRIT